MSKPNYFPSDGVLFLFSYPISSLHTLIRIHPLSPTAPKNCWTPIHSLYCNIKAVNGHILSHQPLAWSNAVQAFRDRKMPIILCWAFYSAQGYVFNMTPQMWFSGQIALRLSRSLLQRPVVCRIWRQRMQVHVILLISNILWTQRESRDIPDNEGVDGDIAQGMLFTTFFFFIIDGKKHSELNAFFYWLCLSQW